MTVVNVKGAKENGMGNGKLAAAADATRNSPSFYDSGSAEIAEFAIMRRFRGFAGQLNPGDNLNHYFHPLNRSNWQTDFANWLIEQNREASND